MVDPNQKLGRRDTIIFGVVLFPLFCAFVAWMLERRVEPRWPVYAVLGLGVAEMLGGLIDRRVWLGAYRAMMYLTFPIALVVSNAILLAMYLAIFTPLGLLARAFGFEPMRRTFAGQASYFVARKPESGSARYFKQF